MSTVAVVLPVYQSDIDPHGAIALASLRRHLPEVPRIIVKPEGLKLRYPSGDFQTIVLDPAHFISLQSYSNLLMTPEFYRLFSDYTYILLYQLDCLLLRGDLIDWCDRGYSYIGSPWLSKDWRRRKRIPRSVGNGGLSLRHVGDFLDALESPEFHGFPTSRQGWRFFLTKPKWWRLLQDCRRQASELSTRKGRPVGESAGRVFPLAEDVFWSFFAPQLHPGMRFPDPREALDFAIESQPAHMVRLNGGRLPFGTHAWYKMDEAFWRDRLAGTNLLDDAMGTLETVT